jgi:hypothetical protein
MKRSKPISRHPLYRALRGAGTGPNGAPLTEKELDRLKLTGAPRQLAAKASRAVAVLHADGHHQGAQREADAASEAIIATLPAEQQDTDYLREPDPDDTYDPAELAAQVSRRW